MKLKQYEAFGKYISESVSEIFDLTNDNNAYIDTIKGKELRVNKINSVLQN
jgi:hypothetical protein